MWGTVQLAWQYKGFLGDGDMATGVAGAGPVSCGLSGALSCLVRGLG